MADASNSPYCVICGHTGRGLAAEYHLTHGVRVWLCGTHRDPRFLRRRRGRVFADRLEAAWRAAGAATVRRLQALTAHRRRMTPDPPQRDRPGSYAWPFLRQEAEDRFAAGEDPDAVIRDLRERYAYNVARVPTVRTMRRWFTEARWMNGAAPVRATAPAWVRRPDWLRRPRVSRWPNLGYDTPLSIHPFGWLLLFWVDDRPPHDRWRH